MHERANAKRAPIFAMVPPAFDGDFARPARAPHGLRKAIIGAGSVSKRRRFLQRSRALALLAIVFAAAPRGSPGADAEHPHAGPRSVDLAARPVDPIAPGAGAVTVLIFVRTDCPISNRYVPE